MIFHAGRLDLSLKGPPLKVKAQDPSPADLQRNEMIYRNARRRSVYLPVVRSNVHRFLTLFDFPNAATPVGKRNTTTVPTQALLMLNDPFVMQQAEFTAQHILATTGHMSKGERVSEIYLRFFGRRPSAQQLGAALEFLASFAQPSATSDDRQLAWASLCQTLMASNEFIYVE